MKGQGTVVLMFSIVMLTALAGFTSIDYLRQSPAILESNINDLNTVAEAESRADLIANRYIPLSGIYSVEQASADLQDQVYSKGEVGNAAENLRIRVEKSASSYLEKKYLADFPGPCQVSTGDISFELKDNGENATLRLTTPGSFAKVTCNQEDIEARYVSSKKSATREVWGNRVLKMAANTQKVMQALKDEAASISPTEGSGTEITSCTFDSEPAAEDAAAGDARSTMRSKFNSIENSIISAGEDVKGVKDMDRRISVDEAASLKDSKVLDTDSSSCSCDSDGDGKDDETCYSGSADYEWDYKAPAFDIRYTDNRYKIPVEAGWKHIKIRSTYRHRFS